MPFPGLQPETPRRPHSCYLAYKHTQVRDFLPVTCSRREVSLSFFGENYNTVVFSWGLVSISTPPQHLLPWTTQERARVQPLSRSVVPESKPFIEVSPAVTSWYCSTSHTCSASFPAREVSFQMPRASMQSWGSLRLDPHLCLLPNSCCTQS